MLLLQAFGIGTSPILIGAGFFAKLLPTSLQKYTVRIGEIFLLLTALILLYRGIRGVLTSNPAMICC
jgi:sulfite exporter TauE/SafE